MKKFSRFDLAVIIAFVVIALLGGGAWYYLSGQLDAATPAGVTRVALSCCEELLSQMSQCVPPRNALRTRPRGTLFEWARTIPGAVGVPSDNTPAVDTRAADTVA